MTVERFIGKRPKPTLHDFEELEGVIAEFQGMEQPVAFAAAAVNAEGNFKTRWVVLPSGRDTDLYTTLSMLAADILDYIRKGREE